ncbi:GGDEF domain-containing protein, partial [Vibrio astriarenae]
AQCYQCTDDMRYVLVLLDLDNFKLINDNFGHPTGDLVLKQVCKALRSKLNKGEYLGRLGGEEFVLLLKNVDDIDVQFRVHSLH